MPPCGRPYRTVIHLFGTAVVVYGLARVEAAPRGRTESTSPGVLLIARPGEGGLALLRSIGL